MPPRAKITFSRPGIQAPVYLVTSLSSPPWDVLEMDRAEELSSCGDPIFYKEFDNTPEGQYQYKIRVGEHDWILDEKAEKATDDSGFVNNVITVKAPPPPEDSSSDSTPEDNGLSVSFPSALKSELEVSLPQNRNMSRTTLNSVQEAAHTTEQQAPDGVPTLVIEKVDNKPTHGDDFGSGATAAQRFAHEQRAADASPDEVVVNPIEPTVNLGTPQPGIESGSLDNEPVPLFKYEPMGNNDTNGTETDSLEFGAPLFKHESFDINDRKDAASEPHPVPSSPTIEPKGSSIASSDLGPIVEDEAETDNFDDPNGNGPGELDHSPLLEHERSHSSAEIEQHDNELDMSPLLPHETGFARRESELDMSPLLPHETGFEQYTNHIHNRSNESLHVPALTHDSTPSDDTGVPLLPHERSSLSFNGDAPHIFVNDGGASQFPHESGSPWSPERVRRSQFFARRTSGQPLTSSLGAAIVREDDPNDPSIEPFPTGRNEILERVATISHRLPEDETVDAAHVHSPAISQACSSTDNLFLDHHHSSNLNSLVEDEEEVSDVEDLPELRPPETKHVSSRPRNNDSFFPATTVGLVEKAIAEDNMKTPKAEYPPGFQHAVLANPPAKRSTEAKNPQNASLQPTAPLTPPHTPERKDDTKGKKPAQGKNPLPPLHSREESSDSMKIAPAPPRQYEEYLSDPKYKKPQTIPEASEVPTKAYLTTDKDAAEAGDSSGAADHDPADPDQEHPRAPTPDSAGKIEPEAKEGFLSWLFRALVEPWMNPLKRFFGSIFGGNREASMAILVLGAAAAASYYVTNTPR